MEGDNSPLALNSWRDMSGPNSYVAALDVVASVVDPEKDDFYKKYPSLTTFISNALYDRIASQSEANYAQFLEAEPFLDESHRDYIQGAKSPSELVRFLNNIEVLKAIEIGRRTLGHEWDVNEAVDRPIRDDLDNATDLDTKSIKSMPLYRIKNLNVVDASRQYYAQIDRKRTVRQHFGGNVLTVVRNSLVLHNRNDTMPVEMRELIHSERQEALRTREKDEPEYDYDKHMSVLHDHLEVHIMNRSPEEKPSWAVPILTTYYSVKKDAIKADQLKEFEVDTDQYLN